MKKLISVLLAMTLVLIMAVPALAAEAEDGYLLISDYVTPNTGEDVSAAIQQVIDSNPNRTIFFPDGEYLLSNPIYTPALPAKSVSLKLADFAVLKAMGEWKKGEAIVQLGGKDPANDTHTNGSNYSFEGGIVDGNGVANGISINSGRETAVRNVSIKHTVVGLHIMYGANNASSDADITGLNIIGTGTPESVGILLEGFDNTLTNIRIGYVFTGVHVKSAGNILRNIHPLYYSDYTDYENSCGFLVESGNNWFDYCYSDQFGIGFRTTDSARSSFHDCFVYWYSADGGTHTAFQADDKFNSTITNFTIGFNGDEVENNVLTVGTIGGDGTIENLDVSTSMADSKVYKAYLKDGLIFDRIIGFFSLLIEFIISQLKF